MGLVIDTIHDFELKHTCCMDKKISHQGLKRFGRLQLRVERFMGVRVARDKSEVDNFKGFAEFTRVMRRLGEQNF